MLTYDEALNLNYYKKTSFTGWMNPLRFLIKMERPEEGDPVFHAWVWPGPYIFDKTDDSVKIDYTEKFYNPQTQHFPTIVQKYFQTFFIFKFLCIFAW